jgi:hypothetical protein
MIHHRTTRCAERGHPEITLQFRQPRPVPVEQMLLGYFERGVAEGKRFAPGETVQIGWATLRLCARPDRTLGVEERDPAGWVESCDQSLMATWLQKEIVSSVGPVDRIAFPAQHQTAIACDRVLTSTTMLLVRSAPRDRDDSGWTITCGDVDHDHNQPSSLHAGPIVDLTFRLPFVTQFLALPPGCDVLVQPGSPQPNGQTRMRADVYLDRQPLAAAPGSYLAALNGP